MGVQGLNCTWAQGQKEDQLAQGVCVCVGGFSHKFPGTLHFLISPGPNRGGCRCLGLGSKRGAEIQKRKYWDLRKYLHLTHVLYIVIHGNDYPHDSMII